MDRQHRRRRAVRTAALALVVPGTVLALSGPASGHVEVSPSTTSAGAAAIVEVSLAHGCEGSPTTRVSIQIPDGVNAVSPTRHPAWQVEKQVVALDPPIVDAHGNQVTERVATVTYTAQTPLPDGYRDVFQLALQIPETPGQTLSFPTIQTCEQGESAWVEVAADGQDAEALELPAPGFEVTTPRAGYDGTPVAGGTGALDAMSVPGAPDEASSPSGRGDRALTLGALGAGLLGALLGGAALLRQRRRA